MLKNIWVSEGWIGLDWIGYDTWAFESLSLHCSFLTSGRYGNQTEIVPLFFLGA